jgi:hypothetical protein
VTYQEFMKMPPWTQEVALRGITTEIASLRARLKAAELARDHTTEINNRLQAERAGDQQLLFHLEGDNARLRAAVGVEAGMRLELQEENSKLRTALEEAKHAMTIHGKELGFAIALEKIETGLTRKE